MNVFHTIYKKNLKGALIMKHYKQIILIASVGLLATGCAKSKPTTAPIQTEGFLETVETTSNHTKLEDKYEKLYPNSVKYQLAKTIQSNVSTSNYEGLLELCDVGEFSVVTADDLKKAIHNSTESNLKYLMGNECQISDYHESDYGGYVTLAFDDNEVNFSFIPQEEEEYYKIELPHFYYKDAILATPGGVNVTINDIKLDSNRAEQVKNYGIYDRRVKQTVTLPNHEDLKIHFTDTLFGDLEAVTTKAGTDEENHQKLTAIPKLNEEQKEEAFHGVRELLNSMWFDISNDVHNRSANGDPDYNNYRKYFSDVVSDEYIQDVVRQMSDQIGDTCGYNSDRVISCTEIRNGEEPKVQVISNNTLAMNLGYRLEWEHKNPLTDILEPESCTRYSHLYVEKQEDGTYKIVGTEDDFFFQVNSFMHQF